MRLRRTEPAQEHLLSAWALARPDDLLEGFGEHHCLLGGMLESVIKPRWPEDFKRIIDITYRFSEGWRYIHNPDTGQAVADNLTTTEFTVAMLMVQDWTTEEIAAHMGVSISTIRRHQAHIRKKLGRRAGRSWQAICWREPGFLFAMAHRIFWKFLTHLFRAFSRKRCAIFDTARCFRWKRFKAPARPAPVFDRKMNTFGTQK